MNTNADHAGDRMDIALADYLEQRAMRYADAACVARSVGDFSHAEALERLVSAYRDGVRDALASRVK